MILWRLKYSRRQEKYNNQCVNDLVKTEIQRNTEIQ